MGWLGKPLTEGVIEATINAKNNDAIYFGTSNEPEQDPFSRIIGYSDIKKQLSRTLEILRNIEAFKAEGAKIPAGLLLSGEPGVGKTLMAMCLIEASGLPCCFRYHKNEHIAV